MLLSAFRIAPVATLLLLMQPAPCGLNHRSYRAKSSSLS